MTVHAYTDGASRGNPGESGIGFILKDEKGTVLYSGSGYIGTTTNNVAEYEALLACLTKAHELSCSALVVHSDSQLMVRQLLGQYRVKDKNLRQYFFKAQQLIRTAPFRFTIIHVEREENHDADLLANAGIDSKRPLSM
ncbi:MAG: ribonuclease HI family protein [Ignavibacteria bacterium]|nr:ribonuclease HI family protein [Ignavibacteria bacterium]